MINIKKFLEKYYIEDEYVILACSTGPDSMFLLYKILETSYKNKLVVCYFNHKLRDESDLEEKWIEDLGKKLGFKVEIASANIKNIQKLYPSKGIEELAREKRYAFLNAIMNIYDSKKVITAHHLDDKLETFFFNLVRGSKLTGLINMKENYGGILRPLLNIEKKYILDYLDKNNLEYQIDKSNFDTKITRNKLRHDILPLFSTINNNYKSNVNNLIGYLDDVKNFIDIQINNFLNNQKDIIINIGKYNNNIINGCFYINDFILLPLFLQKEVIRYIFYISNGNSTIGLTESNINEVLKFINGKNNNTKKDIKNMKLTKKTNIIIY